MTNKHRQVRTYDRLDSLLGVFRDNKFRSADVYDFIQHVVTQEEPSKDVKWPQRYEAVDAGTQKQMEAAADALYEAYTGQGAAYTLERLEGDMQKICNFNDATPHFRPRQHMETFLKEQAIEAGHETETLPEKSDEASKTAAVIAGGAAATQRSGKTKADSTTAKEEAEEQAPPSKESTPPPAQTGRGNEQNLRRAGAAVGAAVSAGAAAGAAHHWRDRVKKPDGRKKAIVFASVATISAVAVAAALFLKRDGASKGRG